MRRLIAKCLERSYRVLKSEFSKCGGLFCTLLLLELSIRTQISLVVAVFVSFHLGVVPESTFTYTILELQIATVLALMLFQVRYARCTILTLIALMYRSSMVSVWLTRSAFRMKLRSHPVAMHTCVLISLFLCLILCRFRSLSKEYSLPHLSQINLSLAACTYRCSSWRNHPIGKTTPGVNFNQN